MRGRSTVQWLEQALLSQHLVLSLPLHGPTSRSHYRFCSRISIPDMRVSVRSGAIHTRQRRTKQFAWGQSYRSRLTAHPPPHFGTILTSAPPCHQPIDCCFVRTRSTRCRKCSRAGTSLWRSRPSSPSPTRCTSPARGRRAATFSCWMRSGSCARRRRSRPSESSRSGVSTSSRFVCVCLLVLASTALTGWPMIKIQSVFVCVLLTGVDRVKAAARWQHVSGIR